jgi:hypothetical protein
MQLTPIWESTTTATQFRASEVQGPSDNVDAGVLTRASAPRCEWENELRLRRLPVQR